MGHAASRLLTHNAVVAGFAVFGPFLFRDILHNKLRLASCINDRADVDFLRKLIDLLLHDGASWEDKALNEIVGDGIYIHFGSSSLNGLDCEISKLFALKKALKDTNIAEDFASKAMDSVISDVVEKYGDYFEVLPF